MMGVCLPSDLAERMHIFERPLTQRVNKAWAVLALPYVSRAHQSALPGWLDHAFKQAHEYSDDGLKLIVVAHLVIPGARISSESIEMARGQDQLFPFERVAALDPAIVFNGHYHAKQVVKSHGLSLVIPGSPVRFTFGEAEEVEKGVVLAEVF
jgi:hypothetical protein